MPKVFNIMQYCKHPKNYGKKKEDVQTSEEKAKNWVWTPGK